MAAGNQFGLLAERRFGPFFAVQLLGALNDYSFMQALMIVLAYRTASFTTMAADTLQNLAQALSALPLFLFSALAGQLADKHDKSAVISAAFAIQLACMALGAAGLLLHSLPLLFGALLAGGVQSTLFAPVKYAILPQQLAPAELVGGNGLVVGGTSLAIVAGLLYGGWLVARPQGGAALVAASTLALSMLALALSRAIPRAPGADPGLAIDWNPVSATWHALGFARADRTVFVSILGMSWFWFYAALVATQLPNLSKSVLAGTEHAATLLMAVFALGMGIGSLLCERLSGHKVEIGLVPLGSIGLTLFGLDLAWASATHTAAAAAGIGAFVRAPGHWRILADLALLGVFGGLYTVPLCALVQERSAPQRRSRIIAASNVLNGAFMAGAGALAIGLFQAGASIPQLILAAALLNAATAIFICRRVPLFLAHFMAWLLIHSVYRLRVSGAERIPPQGAALLVCNHVSYVDALVISAACARPIRWVVDHRIFELPLLRIFFRAVHAIPIAPAKEDRDALARAYDAIARALEAGELVGLFPEGKRTTDGELDRFRGGVRRVLERTPVPVVPMALSGLWQSLFGRNPGKLRQAAKLFPAVGLTVGEPLAPAAATPERLHDAVLRLRGERR